MPFFYFDYYYLLLVVPALLITVWAQYKVKSTFARYSRVLSSRGISGSRAAEDILRGAGLYDIRVEPVAGSLTDHYDPRAGVIRLSQDVYGSTSVASIGVAAHEAGHALQHAEHYAPLKLRNAIIPLTNLGSTLSIPLVLIGYFMGAQPLVTAGIVLFSLVVVFQLITLPVEFNASRRAIAIIGQQAMLSSEELQGAKKVLTAAALTYVASLLVSLANLLRLVLLFGRRRND
ncbi:zinc metallopeptidase [Neobittarella massiliensis]|uniref:Zinc metallopeptidase n=1 Tax=Neobittarella massiliensis (ex Bilen et al. 2018) TaxID=2041842 RepID=A0A8J6IL05_9FIRM|nr:zinc metallopeptidase [Neobittarella massiliensis]MBC3515564.1 zinc metallopeptidase [Neobittarella massiliensis]